MKRKTIGVILILSMGALGFVCACFMGLVLNLMAHLEVSLSPCSSVRVPFILEIILSETGITTLLCCIYIYSEFFELSNKVLKFIIVTFTVNLIFVVFKVVEWPLLVQHSSGWLGSPNSKWTFTNPLLFMSIFYSFALILTVYRKSAKLSNSFVRNSYSLISILLVIEIIFRLINPNEPCLYRG